MKSSAFLLLSIIIFHPSFALQEKEDPLMLHYIPAYGGYSYDIVANTGQWPEEIQFKTSLGNGALFLTANAFVYNFMNGGNGEELHNGLVEGIKSVIEGHAYKVSFLNAQTPTAIQKQEQRIYHHNYFVGSDTGRWKSKVPVFGRITQQQIYKGIDITLYSEKGHLKYDFIIAAGADIHQLALYYEGVLPALQDNGDLLLHTSVNDVIEKKPEAYQVINGRKIMVACNYRVNSSQVSFHFPNGYDTGNVLIIDPEIIFVGVSGSTTRNLGFTATYDQLGNIYGGGIASAIGYPTTPGAYQSVPNGGDIALSALSAGGDTLRYSTYLGGSGGEYPHSLVVNTDNELIVLGNSNSKDYPVTAGALLDTNQGGNDIVITKFSQDGSSILSSTYFGGLLDDGVNSDNSRFLRYNYGDDKRSEIITDQSGNIYIASSTKSTNIPTTSNAVKPNRGFDNDQDGLFVKFSPDLSAVIYCTYLGGTHDDAAYNIVLDQEEKFVYVSGGTCSPDFHPAAISKGWQNIYQKGTTDGFICRLENSGAYAMLSATYVGTNQYDQCHGVQIDQENNVYAMGQTLGAFPVSPGVYHNADSRQFIIKLSQELNQLHFSTVFGSGATTRPNISPTAFLVDRCQNIYVSGWGGSENNTSTLNLPTTKDAYQSLTDGHDFYFLVLSKDAKNMKYGSFLGGPGSRLHVDGGTSRFDPNGYIYQAVCAVCGGASFPVTPGVWSTVSGVNCNLGLAKIKMDFMHTEATTEIYPGTTGCAPFTVSFNNTSSNATTYLWDFGDGTVTSTELSPLHTFDTPGIYRVSLIAKNDTSCVSIDTLVLTITVLPLPEPLYTMNDTLICSGDWSKAFDVGVTLKHPGTYAEFLWEPTAYINGANTHPYINIVPNQAHEYYLTFTDSIPGYCKVSIKDTLNISRRYFDPVPVLTVQEACHGKENGKAWLVHPEGDASIYRYSWQSLNDTTVLSGKDSLVNVGSGNYQVMVTTREGCDTTFTFQVPEIIQKVSFAASDTLVCTGDTVILHNTSGAYFTTWSWLLDRDHVISSAFETSYIFKQPGLYTVTLIGNGGQCSDAIDQVIMVDEPTLKIDFIADHYELCTGESIIFTPRNVHNAIGLTWYINEEPFRKINDYNPLAHAFDREGIYSIELHAIYRACPMLIFKDTIKVHPLPKVKLSEDKKLCLHGTPIYLSNIAEQQSSGFRYLWNTGDTLPTLTVTAPGLYTLTVTSETTHCTGSENVLIEKDCYLDIPNAFSPNGDGINDYFLPRQLLSEGIVLFKMEIFNRWGRRVFITANKEGRGWDGKVSGQEQPIGVYVYQIIVWMKNETIEQYEGNVTLLR